MIEIVLEQVGSESNRVSAKVHQIPRVGDWLQLSKDFQNYTYGTVSNVVHEIDIGEGTHKAVVTYKPAKNIGS